MSAAPNLVKSRRDQTVELALQEVADLSGGVLSPQMVVDFARDPSRKLHWYFEWDDAKAGEQYRLIQAYKLLAAQRKFKVVTSEQDMPILQPPDPIELRQFLSTRTGEGEYVEREVALADPAVRKRNVAAFSAELKGWVRRTSDIEELSEMRAAIEKLLG